MLTQKQRAAYDQEGLVRLPGAVPRDDALRMADRIREFLATQRTGQHEVVERPGGFQPLKVAGAFAPVAVSAIPSALDDLFGREGWERPQYWGAPLVTYKVSDAPWDVSTDSWHIHLRPSGDGMQQRVNFFVVLSELRPEGGGTLILTGSHRLIARFGDSGAKTKTLRRTLGERAPWLADLWEPELDPAVDRRQRYLHDGAVVDGVPMRVVEVTGQPGDAYLMRSDIFHARAPNTLDEPRIMLVGGVSALARQDPNE